MVLFSGFNLIVVVLAVVIGCHYQHNYKVEVLVYLQRVHFYLLGIYITVDMEEQPP